jgi:lysophospholipase L1-like esterase
MKSKIIALGDSIIKGVVLNIEANGKLHYALSDQTIVDQVAQHTHHEVVNLGKMGCTIQAGERIIDRHVEGVENAEYALLCYGGNDSDYDWRAIAQSPKMEHHAKTPIAEFEKIYTRMITKVRNAGLTPLIMSLPAMDAERYYQFFTSSFSNEEKRNISRWLKGGPEAIWAGHEWYNDAVRRVAQACDAQLIDVSSAFGDIRQCLCIDGIHPNRLGQSKIASAIIHSLH